MSPARLSNALDHLCTALSLQEAADKSDGQLLERYVGGGDEVAFEVLLRRHGPMVLAVCRRLLPNPDDAEDAFQATFLVLVHKAASVLPREKVGCWLHGVALHAAEKARTAVARRRDREQQVRTMPEPVTVADGLWHDLLPLLDRELSHLPDRYRLPIVLCDLEGKTRAETARQLGWPEGTVAGRLARGRALLARRMSSHGLPCSAGVLAAVLSQNAASARLPVSLLLSTLQAAKCLTAATGVVPAKVAILMEGVLAAMSLTQVKIVASVLLMLAVAGAGASVCRLALRAAEPAAKKAAAPDKGEVGLAGLRKARLDAARKSYEGVWSQYQSGVHDEEVVYRWSRRLLESQRAVAEKEADRVAALGAHLARMKALEKLAPERLVVVDTMPERLATEKERGKVRVGLVLGKDGKSLGVLAKTSIRTNTAEVTAFFRAEAELWLAEAKEKGTKP